MQAIIGQLTDRLVDPDESENAETQKKKGTRKDLFGIGTAIDVFVTKSLISAIAAQL